MIFSGLNFRSLQQRYDYSFALQANVTNTTGVSLFYFSGTGAGGATEYLSFDFISGRIIDPAGRYVHNYDDNEDFTISGNVNPTDYNYYINNTPFVLSGDKDNFPIRRFFVNATGCNIDIVNLNINVSGSGNLFLSGFNDSRGVGDNQTVSGTVVHSGSGETFNVLSGEVVDGSMTGLFRYSPIAFTNKYPQDIPVSGSKAGLILSGISGIESDVPYSIPTKITTDFGIVEQTVVVTGRERIEYSFFNLPMYQNEMGNDFLTSGTGVRSGDWPLKQKTGQFTATESLSTGGAYHVSGLPIQVSLFHQHGYTGVVSNAVTGTSGTAIGRDYYGDTSVIISGGGGTGAKASGFTSLSNIGTFSGVRIYDGGSGYTSTPDIVIYSGIGEVQIREAGTGYFSPFPILFSGGLAGGNVGSGFCEVDAEFGRVSDFVIYDRGTGYYAVPSLILPIAPGISGVKLTYSGSGYGSTPDITITGGGGTGAAVKALMSYTITGINLLSSGSGFDATPVVNFHGRKGGGSGSFIRPRMSNYSVSGINVTAEGSGYTTLPTVIFPSVMGGGTGAAAVALTGSGIITGFNVLSGGSGYSSGFYPIISGGDIAVGGYSGTGYVSIDHGLRGSGFVTGFEIVSGGTEFTGEFNLFLSGGFTYATPVASVYGCQACTFYPATGLVSNGSGLGSGFITGFKLESGAGSSYPSGGSGYTSAPFLSMSGGGVVGYLSGSGEVVMPTGFSGDIVMSHGMGATAIVGSYSKDFTGQWNLFTGSGGAFYDYRSNGLISGSVKPNAGYTGSVYHFKSNGSDIGVEDNLNIKVTNVNYWDNLISVARLTVSGSGNLINHQLISGVR